MIKGSLTKQTVGNLNLTRSLSCVKSTRVSSINSGRIKIVEGVETKEDVDLDKDLKWNKCQKES